MPILVKYFVTRMDCILVHCPAGNVTDPIWRLLASSLGISCWTPLKPQHSNLNPYPLANQLWSIDSLLLPHLSSSLTDSLPSFNLLCHLKINARSMQDCPKALWSIPYVSVAFFRSLNHNFIAYRSSKVSSRPDCIFEIHQLWRSGFCRVYSNSCCSCWFEPEIIKISQSSHKMYSYNIVNSQESTTILDVCTKKYGNFLKVPRSFVSSSFLWEFFWPVLTGVPSLEWQPVFSCLFYSYMYLANPNNSIIWLISIFPPFY